MALTDAKKQVDIEAQFNQQVDFIRSLDVALAIGIDVEHGGEVYKLVPLTLADWAELVQRRKARALKLYYETVYSEERNPTRRFQDLHNILHRSAIQEDFSIGDHFNLLTMAELSLRRGGRPMNQDQVDKLLADEGFREKLIDIITVLNHGPMSTKNMGGEGEGNKGSDPTTGHQQ